MQSPVLSESNLIASICKESFYEFVKEFWSIIIHEDPVWNWHIEYICNELQIVCERVIAGQNSEYDLLINVPPGSTKSTLCLRMLPAWLWTRMAHAVTICPSHDAPLSIGMGRNCKDLIKSEKYQAAFPEIKIRRDVDANGHFGNTLGGERIAASVNGNIMGKHAHLILTDDPINPKKAASEVELKAINTWMEETLPSRVKDIKKTPKVLIMQRLHQKDPAQKTLDRGGVRHICLPAELSDKVKPKKLRRKYVNGLLDPIRFDPEALKKQKNILSQYAYACQYDQNPIPRAGGMFKVERMVVDTPHKKFIRQVRYWDKAGKADAGCFTVGFKLGEDEDGVLWIKHIVRGQYSS